MARSITYWFNVIVAEKETMSSLNIYQPVPDDAQTFLNDLQGTSKVQRWRIVYWCAATAYYVLDVLFDMLKLDLAAIAAKSRYGTDPWYVQKAKEFQYGDTLVQVDLEWKYATVNPANQIIQLAAARSIPGRVNVKIATIVGGVTQPLSAPQFSAAQGYFAKIRPSTANVQLINNLPDQLKLFVAINFDPGLLTSSGELISSPGTFPAEDAINQYRLNLDFDGRFELMSMIDYIQQATGVVSAYVIDAQGRFGTNPFVSFAQRYYPDAGYMIVDPGTPLSSSLTYTASV